MPYCPKCDMEFVEGVTTCTDCGGPLYDTKEEAMAALEASRKQEEEEMKRRYEEFLASPEGQQAAMEEAEKEEKKTRVRAYVKKEQRYEDMNSSASAFFLVGGILAVLAVLMWSGFVTLPMVTVSRYIFQGVVTVMAVGCFAVAVSSRRSAKELKIQAADEEKETEEILHWFLITYSGDDLDSQSLMDEPDLSPEELSLKRFELIQDYLITGRDLPDQAYVDSLCDMIYAKLYDEKEE